MLKAIFRSATYYFERLVDLTFAEIQYRKSNTPYVLHVHVSACCFKERFFHTEDDAPFKGRDEKINIDSFTSNETFLLKDESGYVDCIVDCIVPIILIT